MPIRPAIPAIRNVPQASGQMPNRGSSSDCGCQTVSPKNDQTGTCEKNNTVSVHRTSTIPTVVRTDNRAQQNRSSRMLCSWSVISVHRFCSEGRWAVGRMVLLKRVPAEE